MQMQKDLGVLGEKIDRMREDFVDQKKDGKEVRDKLVDVEKSISGFEGSFKAYGRLYALVLVIVAALLAWFLRPITPPSIPASPTVAQPSQSEGVPEKVIPPKRP